jgi:hypothetical protein
MSTQHVRGPRVYVCKKTNITKEYLKSTDLQEGTDCWLPESQHAPATPCLIGPHIASFAYAAIRGCLVPLHLATAASRDPTPIHVHILTVTSVGPLNVVLQR